MAEKKSEGFNDEMSMSLESVSNGKKTESFEDTIRVLESVLTDTKYKKHYISILPTRKNAIGIIQGMSRINFLRQRFGKIRIPVYETDMETGEVKIKSYKEELFNCAGIENVIIQALINYPSIKGKRSEQIVDMIKANNEQLQQTQTLSKLLMGGNRR